jgi:hypothetical protein
LKTMRSASIHKQPLDHPLREGHPAEAPHHPGCGEHYTITTLRPDNYF